MTDTSAVLPNEALLDNPIWNSLTTGHAQFSAGDGSGRGLARRYPDAIGPLAGLREPTWQAYEDLGAMVPEGDVAVLFLEEKPHLPPGWQLLRGGQLVQMVCRTTPPEHPLHAFVVPLAASDVPEMLALTALTEPGPFRQNTIALGGFLGIRVDGRLAAMAGRRLAPAGFSEISAVCTHPDFSGRGFARALVTAVARNIYAEGRTPFLTSFATNAGAIRVYQQVGFALRRSFELAVVQPPARS